jgi:hypothetical protein
MANVCSEYILACEGLARKAGNGMTEGALFTVDASTGAGVIVSTQVHLSCSSARTVVFIGAPEHVHLQ